jgi:twitching motility protein PilT
VSAQLEILPSISGPASSPRCVSIEQPKPREQGLTPLLEAAARRGASDLLLVANRPPVVHCKGAWISLCETPLGGLDIWRCIDEMMSPSQRETYERERDLDFAFSREGLGRFRVNAHFQRGLPAAAIRAIPNEIPAFAQLGLPREVLRFADIPHGLVLITGGTGQGKSTTLASIINHMNQHRSAHVITIEDPIEFDFPPGTCLIEQREIGSDSPSFPSALRHVLRQRPDVILIGEMRDLETMSTALTAAETGHLVLASLHTASAAQTIGRIIDVFPPAQQGQVRVQLAASLRAILCQSLLRGTVEGEVLPATELLFASNAIRRAIRENETHLIYAMIETGKRFGMHTLEQSLTDLVRSDRITAAGAFECTSNPPRLEKLLGCAAPQETELGFMPAIAESPGMPIPWGNQT